jgi:hypothetical protein
MQQRAIVGLSLLILAAGLASCSEPKSDNALYKELAAIMDERKVLWEAEGDKRSRRADVSDIVCPVVSEKALEEMAADQGLSGVVEYKFYERSSIYRDNTKLWTVSKPENFFSKQLLMIESSPENPCFAAYLPRN